MDRVTGGWREALDDTQRDWRMEESVEDGEALKVGKRH